MELVVTELEKQTTEKVNKFDQSAAATTEQ